MRTHFQRRREALRKIRRTRGTSGAETLARGHCGGTGVGQRDCAMQSGLLRFPLTGPAAAKRKRRRVECSARRRRTAVDAAPRACVPLDAVTARPILQVSAPLTVGGTLRGAPLTPRAAPAAAQPSPRTCTSVRTADKRLGKGAASVKGRVGQTTALEAHKGRNKRVWQNRQQFGKANRAAWSNLRMPQPSTTQLRGALPVKECKLLKQWPDV